MSPSSIAVAGKFESLNLTASSENSIEKIDRESDLNLFPPESPSIDESYLNLFKSPEDVFYENIARKRKLKPGVINVVCLEENSDSESDDVGNRYEKIENITECDSKPKIIDFLPLDDDFTKPVFDKITSMEPNKRSSEQGSSSNSVEESPLTQEEDTCGLKNTSFLSAKKFFEQLEVHKELDIRKNENTSAKN